MIEHFFYLMCGIMGIITTGIIFIQHKLNRAINNYLLVLFVLVSFKYIFDGITYFDKNLQPTFSYMPFLSVIFPLLYLYISNIIANSKKLNKGELQHFLFPLLFGFLNLFNNYFDFIGYHSLTVLHVIFTIYSIIYMVKTYKLLKDNIWNRKSNIIVINEQNNLLRKWILFIYVIFLIVTTRLLLTLIFDLINDDYSGGRNYQWISGIFWVLILIKILTTPEILFGYNALYKKIHENKKPNLSLMEIWLIDANTTIKNQQDLTLKDKINTELIKNIKAIEKIALEEKFFRKPKITSSEIAKKLDIPKSHLSFIFKYHCKISFTEFKNIIKIYDALQLIENDFLKLNTLDALAIKVGFSSYNPFFTSFKDVTGTTPQAYNKNIQDINKAI
jgi:AraC-like DNA-binding protein